MESISEMIGTLGFPICCVIALFWQSVEERKARQLDSDKWVQALNHNTLVIQKVLDKLDMENKEEDDGK